MNIFDYYYFFFTFMTSHLEKSLWPFLLDNFFPAVHRALVHFLSGFSRHHHETSPDGVEWVCHSHGAGSHGLGNCESRANPRVLEHLFSCVISTKVDGSESQEQKLGHTITISAGRKPFHVYYLWSKSANKSQTISQMLQNIISDLRFVHNFFCHL